MVDPNDDPIELHESDHERWRRQFRAERDRIERALSADTAGRVERIDHVGSTAVPGLAAKDVVDVDVVVADDAVDPVSRALEAALGGRRVENGPDWHPLFREHGGQRFNLHVFARSSPGWRTSVVTREVLRADPELRRTYERRKRALAADTDDLTDYSRGKTDLVREMLRRARASPPPGLSVRVPDPGRVGPDSDSDSGSDSGSDSDSDSGSDSDDRDGDCGDETD